jgi:hypothetical protein
MTIKLANRCNQNPKQQQQGDTHNGNDENGNKAVAMKTVAVVETVVAMSKFILRLIRNVSECQK